ncbi:MAG: Mut7-C RNAse domain-containing protein [Nitrospirota bacterium]
MKFIADVMLGRLARRMRLLGLDVLYNRTLNDNEIIRLSLEQDRVILTRDKALSDRPLSENHLFINSDLVQEQVDQVLSSFPLETLLEPFSRCSECNDPLSQITREEAKDLVPQHVYENKYLFLRCPRCKRTYWQGTHVMRMAIAVRKK